MWYCYKCQQWVISGVTHTCFNFTPTCYYYPASQPVGPTWDQWERIVKALEKLASKED